MNEIDVSDLVMDTELNEWNNTHYFGDPDFGNLLKRVRKFVKEDPEKRRASSLNVQIHWDADLEESYYEAYLLHGGF